MGCNFTFDKERSKQKFHVSVEDEKQTSHGISWLWDSSGLSAVCWFRVCSKAQYDSAMFKEQ